MIKSIHLHGLLINQLMVVPEASSTEASIMKLNMICVSLILAISR